MGQVFGVGSIIEFKPDRFEVTVIPLGDDQESDEIKVQAIGWGVVVVSRDGWVVKTGVVPVVVCCGVGGVSLDHHWAVAHRGEMVWAV